MKTLKHIFQLNLSPKEAVWSKRIMAGVMLPIFMFYMTSMNFLIMGMMKASAADGVVAEVVKEEPKVEPAAPAPAPAEEPAPVVKEAAPVVEPAPVIVPANENQNNAVLIETAAGGGPVVETPPTPGVITPQAASIEKVISVVKPEWQISADGKSEKIGPVVIGTTYVAPQNSEVTVTFTTLPENSGTLSIEEITLTPEQVKTLGALSNKAYDITSDMADGTFAYDLTLPKPANQENVEIKFAETEAGLENAETVAASDITTETTDSVSVALDHFTIFVITGTAGSVLTEASDAVVINEFMFVGSNDWVELYNKGALAQDLDKWTLEDSGSVMATISSKTIPAGGFLVVEVSDRLNADGDTMILKNDSVAPAVVSQVTYKDGTINSAQEIGTVNAGESVARTTNGGSTWSKVILPTKNYTNENSTIYVDDNGTDGQEFGTSAHPFKTIQKGIDSVAVGGTVNVLAGNYIEQIKINKSLDLIGAGQATTTILAPGTRTETVSGKTTYDSSHSGATQDYLLAAYTNEGTIDVRVEGFTFDANGQNKMVGTTRLDGVFFRDVKDNGGTMAGLFSSTIHNFATTPDYESWGLTVFGDSTLSVDGNEISDYTRDGLIVVGDGTNATDPIITINANTITGSATALNGILIDYKAAATITGNTVTGHTRSAPWAGAGIVVSEADGATVSGNTVSGNFYGIDLSYGTKNATISGNTLKNNIKRGITLDDSDNNTVKGNTINGPATGTDDVAIGLVNTSTGNTIGGSNLADKNIITMATAGTANLYAIHVEGNVGAGNNTIQNNAINGGKRTIQIDGGNTGVTTISNNNIGNTLSPSFAGIYLNGGNATISGNTLKNAVRPIEFQGAIAVTISGNTINGSIYDGINAGSASGAVKINGDNKIYNIADNQYGIHVQSGVKNIEIDGNEIYSSYKGIGIESGATGAKITNNNIHDNSWSAISLDETVSSLTGNTINANARGIETSKNLTANNNSFTNNSYCSACGFPSGTFDLTKNWWGTDQKSSIEAQIPLNDGNVFGTNITYNPWYNTNAKTTKTYQVGAGETYTTIQSAIDAANPAGGDTINVKAGTYTENLTINKSLTLSGAGDTTIINGAIDATGSNVTIQNLEITNQLGASWDDPIFWGVRASANNTLTLNSVTIDVLYYGVHMRETNSSNAIININNCNIKGYGAIVINSYGGGIVNNNTHINIADSTLTGTTKYSGTQNDFAVISLESTTNAHIDFTGANIVANEYNDNAQSKERLVSFTSYYSPSSGNSITGTKPDYSNAANSTVNDAALFMSSYNDNNTVQDEIVARYVEDSTEFESALLAASTTPIVTGGDIVTIGNNILKSGATLIIEANTSVMIAAGKTLTNNGTIIVESGATFINNGTINGSGAISETVGLSETPQDVTVGNLTLKGVTGSGSLFVAKYAGLPPTGGLGIGVAGYYYDIQYTSSLNFPLNIKLSYDNSFDENHFSSLYYYNGSEWKDYKLDTPASTISIDKDANKITASLQHLTPIVPVLDITNPSVSITSPIAGQVTGHALNIEGTASDLNFNYYYCYVSGASGEVGVRDAQCATAWSAGSPFHSAFAQTATGTTNGHLGSINLTGVADGTYTVHLVAKDNVGNSAESTQSFILDNTAPTNPGTPVSTPNPTNSPTQAWTWLTSTDSSSGVESYYQSIHNVITLADSAWSWIGNMLGVSTSLTDGQYQMRLKAEDNAGNQSGVVSSATLTVDTNTPTSSISVQGDLEETKNIIGNTKWFESFDNVNLKIDIGDQSSDVIYYQVLDGDVSCPNQSSSDYISVAHDTNLASLINSKTDGAYSLCYFAKDLAGNAEATTHKELLKKDNTNPTFSIDSVSGNLVGGVYYNSTGVTAQITVNDPLSGYSHARYDLYNAGSDHSCTTLIGTNKDTASSAVDPATRTLSKTGLSDGNYCLRVWAYDKVQNKGLTDSSGYNGWIKFSIDATAPEFTLSGIKYPNGTVQNKYSTNLNTPIFKGNLTSGDIASVKVSVNGTDYAAALSVSGWEATVSPALSDGSYAIQVTATDNAGNNTVISKTLIIDTKVPSASYTYYKNGIAITEPIAYVQGVNQLSFIAEYFDESPSSGIFQDSYVIFDANEAGTARTSKSYCSWRNPTNTLQITNNPLAIAVPFTNCEETLAEGEYFIYHQIYDNATRKDIPSINQYRDVKGLHFVVDMGIPDSTITTFGLPNGASVTTSSWNGRVDGTASDTLSDVNSGVNSVKLEIARTLPGASLKEYWDGSIWQSETVMITADGGASWNYQMSGTIEEGTYQVTSHAVDNAGNVENTYSITIIYDKTIPEVTLAIDPVNPEGDNSWYLTNPTITLTANDNFNVDRIEYQLDSTGGSWLTYNGPIKLDDGNWKFYYRSIDKAGNISDAGLKNVKADTQDPDNVNSFQAEYRPSTTAVRLTWNVNDNDTKSVYIYRGGSRNFTVNSSSRLVINDNKDESYNDNNINLGQTYFYKAVTRDDAGNNSSASVIKIVIPSGGTAPAVSTALGTEVVPEGTILGTETGAEGQPTVTEEPQGTEVNNVKPEVLGENVQKSNQPLWSKWWFWLILLGVFSLPVWLFFRNRPTE